MPLYEVFHSTPLSVAQRQNLALALTELHSTTFTTPSFFVHIQFIKQNAADANYSMAGESCPTNSNRILANVRTTHARSKTVFDTLARKMETVWYEVVQGSAEDELRRLRMVAFTQLVTIREAGMTIPEAGKEQAWFKEHTSYIKHMNSKGLEEFGAMLDELQARDDLRHLLK